jgi:hypothetical protein
MMAQANLKEHKDAADGGRDNKREPVSSVIVVFCTATILGEIRMFGQEAGLFRSKRTLNGAFTQRAGCLSLVTIRLCHLRPVYNYAPRFDLGLKG